MKVAIKLTGLNTALASLDLVSTKLRKRILRRAFTKAARIVAKKAKSKLPNKSTATYTTNQTQRIYQRYGLLKKSIGSKVRTNRKTGDVYVVIGPRKGFKENGRNPEKYAHLVEYGTRHSKARPFLRPALKESKQQIIELIKNEIFSGILSGR